jgi:hypothetical protein
MRPPILALAFAVGLGALSAPPVAAKPPQREQASVVDIVFSEIEKRLIREYYAGGRVATADSLPPGIRKKLARGKPLPPGIAKRFLPGELEGRLPVHAGTVRRVVGNDVVLVAVATGVVLDILFDVIKG